MDNTNLEINLSKINDISIIDVKTLYFNPDAIQESGIKLHRLDHKSHRNYFTVTKENRLDKIYTSVTTFAKSVMPTSAGLIMWMKNKTPEEQEAILKSSSTYGTLMDILFNKMLISGKIDDIGKEVFQFTMKERLYNINLDQWIEQLKRDCLAFAQFVEDYEVKPILVSCPLKSDNIMIAGTLDLLCEMNDKIPTKTDIKKGVRPNRINAIIDYKAKIGDMTLKSDRNSFYDSECLQLQLYKKLYYDSFNDDRYIQGLYNFSPKNWRTSPDYNLKSWLNTKTANDMSAKFDSFLNIFKIDSMGEEKSITVIDDSISLDGFKEQFRSVLLTDFINKTLEEAENDKQASI